MAVIRQRTQLNQPVGVVRADAGSSVGQAISQAAGTMANLYLGMQQGLLKEGKDVALLEQEKQ